MIIGPFELEFKFPLDSWSELIRFLLILADASLLLCTIPRSYTAPLAFVERFVKLTELLLTVYGRVV